MADNRRNQLLEFVEREFIGPDPVDQEGFIQSNGEEILKTDPPNLRYIAGILFPMSSVDSGEDDEEPEQIEMDADECIEDNGIGLDRGKAEKIEYLEEAEELINRSNAYRQSAISLTVALTQGDRICVNVTAGRYITLSAVNPSSGKKTNTYHRVPIEWNNTGEPIALPDPAEGMTTTPVDSHGLQFDVTYRYRKGDYSIYTFTLENTNGPKGEKEYEACFFQTKFTLFSEKGFCPLPESQKICADDDYWSNEMMYRSVHNYAIGHGCAADWDDSEEKVYRISSAVFPTYEIKPIVPGRIPGVSLDMLRMSPYGDFAETIKELNNLCDRYQEWINGLKSQARHIEPVYKTTAHRHIENCEKCLMRMRRGVTLLKENRTVWRAFQFMNQAMLMQQLHYNLPLQKWEDDGVADIRLVDAVEMLPEEDNPDTWYGDRSRYGKWRPFQLAFILINLHSMYDKTSNERKIVDLIWFPTGGGKTEAYLGLAAYTIFIRRMVDKADGTAILMRYTLRLLTAQQYERASSMICACDLIRKENENLLGKERISIGLWVGAATTPNRMKDAVAKYDSMKSGKGYTNPFVLLKCPWCGAQMGPVERKKGIVVTPGYQKIPGPRGQKRFAFVCYNSRCDFSKKNYSLPLHIIDEEIYEVCPTLLLGTVDKFAMLPFRPEAQGLFGYKDGCKVSSPDLIIQDELHLISGPLGSMVGHYETMINELCTMRTTSGEIKPKIIASTATISHAKEQCHSLYACGRDNVFQFPPPGLDAGNSFFAVEDKTQNGRKYVGILATGSSSDTTTAIRLYASLLYAAKAIDVNEEKDRDPYWTNIGYFNSIRELGQAATWIRADIDQHLDVMYKRRNDHKRYSKEEYNARRRYIWRDEELTSRVSGDKVTASLSNLNISYPPVKDEAGKVRDYPIDICLATNMISVGLDVTRLGLMTVAGQPKTTSEYIQATSRVGRDARNAPGIVFVLYRPGRPRDKSHYEQFRDYHSRIYCHVEPTSVTPFSAPVRERALHAVMIGIMRLEGDKKFNEKPIPPDKQLEERIRKIIENRVNELDPKELDATLNQMEYFLRRWNDWLPERWEPERNRDWSYGDKVPLMYAAGSFRNERWGNRGIETPMSMRSVDAACEAEVLSVRYSESEE